jgi:hypothetical protein
LRDQRILDVEAGFNTAGILEAAQKKSGADQREHGECNFDPDQHASEAMGMRSSNSAAAAFIQSLAEVCAHG